jgi:hypothetical protein
VNYLYAIEKFWNKENLKKDIYFFSINIGGGFCNLSISKRNEYQDFEMIANKGTYIGGDDFD